MAVSPKTQLLKLVIGAVSVAAITGATGWIYQTHSALVQPSADQVQGGGATSSDSQQQPPSFRLGRSGTTSSTAPGMHTRSRHS